MSMIETLPDAETSVQVTLCPPGRRSKAVVVREPIGTIPVSTSTALKWPTASELRPAPISDTLRTLQERREAAERAEAQSVALAQPHRQGRVDECFGTPLGRFCEARWPGEVREAWRKKMFAAGECYDQIVRDSKIALGLPYLGQAGGAEGSSLTEAQIEARKELALRRRKRADEALREIKLGLPALLERFVYEQRDLGPYDEDLAAHGLWKIANEFGLLEKGVHDRIDSSG